jgi:hypothetical protein
MAASPNVDDDQGFDEDDDDDEDAVALADAMELNRRLRAAMEPHREAEGNFAIVPHVNQRNILPRLPDQPQRKLQDTAMRDGRRTMLKNNEAVKMQK